jgi:hypothetical protein
MSDAAVPQGPSGEPHIAVLPIDDALRVARPLPPLGEMAIEGLTDDEWDAFERALSER